MRDSSDPAAAGDDIRLERLPAVLQRIGLSRAQVYRLIKKERFPQPVRLGPNSRAWSSVEITLWIRRRLAERDGVNNRADGDSAER